MRNGKWKWKIINDLTNSSPAFNVQPIAEEQDDGSTKYLFEDNEILGKMEQYHLVKMVFQTSTETRKS